MKNFYALSFCLCLCLFLGTTPTFAEDRSPIVLELFTSQSCSSCPPADNILSKMTQRDNVIALSCHVTYWNHLHWKDTLSQKLCTQRQRQYVSQLHSRGPYTPQLVVNGKYELVGSRKTQIEKLIEKSATELSLISVIEKEEHFKIDLPKIKAGQYIISLVTYGKNHTQSIPSGENRGRVLSYTNPVQKIDTLEKWDGDSKSLILPKSIISGAHGFAILAHSNNQTGPIIAAGKY